MFSSPCFAALDQRKEVENLVDYCATHERYNNNFATINYVLRLAKDV